MFRSLEFLILNLFRISYFVLRIYFSPCPPCLRGEFKFQVIPDGIEPSSSACRAGVVPLDHGTLTVGPQRPVTEMGVEPTKSPRSQRDRFANLRTRPSRTVGASFRSEGLVCRFRFALLHSSKSDQGESRTRMPVRARRSERRASTNSATWSWLSCRQVVSICQ